MQTRLATISPVLAKQLSQSPKAAQKRAVFAVCLEISRELGWSDDNVRAALALMDTREANTIELRNKFMLLSEDFDEKYFDAHEASSRRMTDEVRDYFRKARAASAFAFGLSPIEADRQEALYEAAMASAHQSSVLQAAATALQSA